MNHNKMNPQEDEPQNEPQDKRKRQNAS